MNIKTTENNQFIELTLKQRVLFTNISLENDEYDFNTCSGEVSSINGDLIGIRLNDKEVFVKRKLITLKGQRTALAKAILQTKNGQELIDCILN